MNALKLDEETIYHVARRITDTEARAGYLALAESYEALAAGKETMGMHERR